MGKSLWKRGGKCGASVTGWRKICFGTSHFYLWMSCRKPIFHACGHVRLRWTKIGFRHRVRQVSPDLLHRPEWTTSFPHRPLFPQKMPFLSPQRQHLPPRERMSPTFWTRTGHSTDCPRSVHGLFHRSGPADCRKMPGQARIFGFSTVSRPLTAVTAERYTDRQIDCSP